jgi:hypothetical protein
MKSLLAIVLALVVIAQSVVTTGGEVAVPDIAAAVSAIDTVDLGALIARTAGDVRPEKVAAYPDFQAYWRAASPSFEGKTFEAMIADTVNSRSRATGAGRRLLPTAAMGEHGHAADLFDVQEGGKVAHVQAKLGYQAMVDAIDDPRYVGMDLVTTQDTFDALRAEVSHAATRAAAGQPVSPKLKAVGEAIESGRIWKSLPCGAPLLERAHVTAVTEAHYAQRWHVAEGLAGAGRVAVETKPAAAAGQATAVADDAGRAAATTADDVARAAGGADDVARAAASSADEVAFSLGKRVVAWAGPVATAVEISAGAFECHGTEVRYAAGEINAEEREVAHARVAGAIGGGAIGGSGGAAGGAAIGTLICPGPGTLVGAVVGGVGGSLGGSEAGRYAAGKTMEAVHRTGVTVAAAADRAGDCVGRAYDWLTDW